MYTFVGVKCELFEIFTFLMEQVQNHEIWCL